MLPVPDLSYTTVCMHITTKLSQMPSSIQHILMDTIIALEGLFGFGNCHMTSVSLLSNYLQD